jgi:hypothetical protein
MKEAMKKLIMLAVTVMAMACGVPGAKAIPLPRTGMTTNCTALNVSLIIVTNGMQVYVSNYLSEAVGRAKIDNATLLNLFAHWDGTNTWPAGARLVMGWDSPWAGRVLVVDQSKTNVLFNADATATNYFIVNFDYGYDGATELYKYDATNPGSAAATGFFYGYFELRDEGVYLTNTDISGYGDANVSGTMRWNKEHIYTAWSTTAEMDSSGNNPIDESWMGEPGVQVRGAVKTSGSGKGENDYWPF